MSYGPHGPQSYGPQYPQRPPGYYQPPPAYRPPSNTGMGCAITIAVVVLAVVAFAIVGAVTGSSKTSAVATQSASATVKPEAVPPHWIDGVYRSNGTEWRVITTENLTDAQLCDLVRGTAKQVPGVAFHIYRHRNKALVDELVAGKAFSPPMKWSKALTDYEAKSWVGMYHEVGAVPRPVWEWDSPSLPCSL